ncbi:MAG: UTP--glucose-1-phosphate uridylyltransferase [Patescibacteria group bacterium]
MKITKAVIPVAGLGTRFLPITKSIPKEMLPILDKPTVQYIVEEAVNSGIKDIIFVTLPQKKAIENYFKPNPDLEKHLEQTGKIEQLKEIQNLNTLANFIFINQSGPYGNGTPVLNAKKIIGNEPFAVMWGDDVFISKNSPCLLQLIKVFEKFETSVLCSVDISDEETKKYGVIEGEKIEENIFKIKQIVEKPGPDQTKSRLGSVGRYILSPEIFEILEKTPLGKNNELWLVDAIASLGKKQPLYTCKVDAKYYDLGSPGKWLKANLDFAKKREDLKEEILLKTKIQNPNDK